VRELLKFARPLSAGAWDVWR